MSHDLNAQIASLRAAGAPGFDAVGWHYIETLAERYQTQSGAAHALLKDKLQHSLDKLHGRMKAAAQTLRSAQAPAAASPLGTLLQEIQQRGQAQAKQTADAWRAENPRIQQFRQQLSQLSVQKQVKQAIAQAPQNAGPINSHMLVLRSLGLMRSLSHDYLNRFMVHVDTLLFLQEAEQVKASAAKASPARKKPRSRSA